MNTDTNVALNKEYLDVKTTVHGEMDEEDVRNEAMAVARLMLTMTRDENDLVHLQEYHDSLNMSRKLYDHIKKGTDHGNYLIMKGRNSTAGGF